ncbi:MULTISPECIES: NAD(P)/FAD-dependent oxidoreductase [Methylotenera]|uniref:NAD(P)/FAD-dependent oxidoreductase n=1 Tax=Methylotenera TaxID=359407 RepID=UPI00036F138F|nr:MULTISPECIES: FAD-dependent oxidoreductase [Methylotenera]
MTVKEVIVVGGGIVGCLTALELIERGCDVTLVERNVVASQTSGESSWAGAGILFPLLPWMYKDTVNQLAIEGAAIYPKLCERLLTKTGIDPEHLVSGMQILNPSNIAEAVDWCEKNSIAYQQNAEGLLLPHVAQVRPPQLLKALRQALLQNGVTLLERTELQPLNLKEIDNTELNTWQTNAGETLTADQFVVTSGAWSFELLKNTTQNLDIKPMRGQILLYEQTAEKLAHIVYANGFYLVPRKDGLLLAGSTLEDVGFDKNTTEIVKQELQTKAESILPSLKNTNILKHWSGLRPGTPDNLPTIAAHSHIKNLFLNTGHFRYGLTMAPASARRIVALMCD